MSNSLLSSDGITHIHNINFRLMDLPFNRDIPEYVINLDLPPEERWKELVRDKTSEVSLCTSDSVLHQSVPVLRK